MWKKGWYIIIETPSIASRSEFYSGKFHFNSKKMCRLPKQFLLVKPSSVRGNEVKRMHIGVWKLYWFWSILRWNIFHFPVFVEKPNPMDAMSRGWHPPASMKYKLEIVRGNRKKFPRRGIWGESWGNNVIKNKSRNLRRNDGNCLCYGNATTKGNLFVEELGSR